MTDNPARPVRIAQLPVRLRGSLDIAQTGGGVAAKAAGFPGAVAAHNASAHLTECDETVAIDTGRCGGVYGDSVRRFGAWLTVGRFCAEDMCTMMFGRTFSHHGVVLVSPPPQLSRVYERRQR